MEIILKKDVENLGYANDIISVRPGYANNFLIPQGYATVATPSAKKVLAENIKQRAHKEAKIQADAEKLAAQLSELAITIAAKAGETGKIFGAVTASDVAEAIAAKGINIDKKSVVIESIKIVGAYIAVVKVHKDIKAEVKVEVVAE